MSVTVECFSCSGGMAEGFRRAGIAFDWVFDKDPDACASYEQNLGHRPVQMDVRDLVRMARGGWSPGPVRLIVADPPCTPWSRAGKRQGRADERDMLDETVDLIALLKPAAYLIGNVPGLDDSTQWHNIQDALARLAPLGYCIADYAQLDAADYGVPTRNLALPGCDLQPWVTCREALGHLSVDELGRPVRMKRLDPKHPPCSPDEPWTTVRSGGNGNAAPHVALRLDDPNHPPALADEVHRTITTQSKTTACLEWPWDRPATTLQADDRLPPPGHHDEDWKDAKGERARSSANAIVLSERAASILQGFPAGWTFAGATKRARWSQLGQAMPPGLAHAVAQSVAEQMAAAGDRAA